MREVLLITIAFAFFSSLKAQDLREVAVTEKGALSHILFHYSEGVDTLMLVVDAEGSLKVCKGRGTEIRSSEESAALVLKKAGYEDYINKDKWVRIGNLKAVYYSSEGLDCLKGKLARLGSVKFEYRKFGARKGCLDLFGQVGLKYLFSPLAPDPIISKVGKCRLQFGDGLSAASDRVAMVEGVDFRFFLRVIR
ncbi:MAG: hypothetical protein MI784_18150 [Cytophagales bacterium]|nr:hypothetical protein [Cytophagales bacterium]